MNRGEADLPIINLSEIEREVMLSDPIVHNFLMMEKYRKINHEQALYGIINTLSKERMRLIEENQKLVERMQIQEIERKKTIGGMPWKLW